jgi:putative transposase
VPWKETRIMDERMRFILAVEEEEKKGATQFFARLCASFGIKRATGYKWVARFNEGGASKLADRPRTPGSCPHATPPEVVDCIVALRKERPYDGPKKLRALLLEREPKLVIPAASTIGDILDDNGLIRPRRKRLRVPPSSTPLSHAAQPNDLWCTDYKGDFRLGDGSRCYPLTISDAASRYAIKIESLPNTSDALAWPQFERAFREFGVPLRIRSDNGAPFATKTIGGLSKLSVRWIRLGITPERIEPGHPEQNGREERLHLTMKQQVAPQANLVEQQRAYDRFRHDYNDVRPHEALGQTPPARRYEPSWRPMPSKLLTPEYEAEVVPRLVNAHGQVSWKGERLTITALLESQPVGFKPVHDDEWQVFYGPVLLGWVARRNGKPCLRALP